LLVKIELNLLRLLKKLWVLRRI